MLVALLNWTGLHIVTILRISGNGLGLIIMWCFICVPVIVMLFVPVAVFVFDLVPRVAGDTVPLVAGARDCTLLITGNAGKSIKRIYLLVTYKNIR